MSTLETGSQLVLTVSEWRATLLKLDEPVVRYKPQADRWSIAEVIGHLVDSACNNHQRFVRAQLSDSLTFPAYDQNLWVAVGNYQLSEWSQLVELWYSYNLQVAHTMAGIPAGKLDTPCTISPNATCTLDFLVTDYLDHLNHHLKKIRDRIDGSEVG